MISDQQDSNGPRASDGAVSDQRDTHQEREREKERPGSIPLDPRMPASLAAKGGNWDPFFPATERERASTVKSCGGCLLTTTILTAMAVATVDPSRSRSSLLIILQVTGVYLVRAV